MWGEIGLMVGEENDEELRGIMEGVEERELEEMQKICRRRQFS
jgi:hypothetical protein